MRFVLLESSPLDTESDADLLLFAAAGDEIECRQAANAFFSRYVNGLYSFCRQFQQTLGGEAAVSDLVIMTFQRAFEHADSFVSNGIRDQEHSRARTFRWLATISNNLMRDWLKKIGEDHPLSLTSIPSTARKIEGRFAHTEEETTPRRYVRLPDDAAEKIHDPTASREFIGNDSESPLTISPEKNWGIITNSETYLRLLRIGY